MSSITLAATGDSFITRRLPAGDSDAAAIAQTLSEAEVRFTNLETVIRREEGFPAAQSGGTWASSPPEVLDDLKRYGFNLTAWANNHTLDYSSGGLMGTRKYLNRAGLVHAGAGRDLAEAEAVRYLDVPSGRVALIAVTSTFHESWVAGHGRPGCKGRPGINPLRFQTVYRVSAKQLATLRAVANATGINAKRDLSIKEGFTPPDQAGEFRLGTNLFAAVKKGQKPGAETRPHDGDMKRVIVAIKEAALRADLVLVSVHCHEMTGDKKELPPEFLEIFSRGCIDGGAHAVIGHGPHIVRGVEIYKRRPIFYSLGNFIFQNDTVENLPTDFYIKYGLDPFRARPAEACRARSKNDRIGLGANPAAWSSVIPLWRMEKGVLRELRFHPVILGFGEPAFQRGWPRLTADTAVLRQLQKLSRPYGTKLHIENGTAIWRPR